MALGVPRATGYTTGAATAGGMSDIAGAFVLLALVYAPWAMGAQPPLTIRGLEGLAASAFVVWVVGLLADRRLPRVPLFLWMTVSALLVFGWVAALVPRSTYDVVTTSFSPEKNRVIGSVDGRTAVFSMLGITALLATIVMVCDLVGRQWFRLGILWVVSGTGVSIALLGIVQKLGVETPFSRAMSSDEGLFFATFNYHGNAGAYLNLVAPLIGVLFVLQVRQRGWCPSSVLVGMGLVIVLTGLLVTTSKASQVIGVALVIGLVGIVVETSGVRGRRSTGAVALVVVCVVMVAGIALTSSDRWRSVAAEAGGSGFRVSVWRIGWQLFQDRPMFGDGPGTFKVVLPVSPKTPDSLRGMSILYPHVPGTRVSQWNNLHQDYLQTLIEWGVVGTLAWAALVLGGLSRLWQSGSRSLSRSPERVLLIGVGLSLAGVYVHALVDFPLQVLSIGFYVAVLLGVAWGSPNIGSHGRDEWRELQAEDCQGGEGLNGMTRSARRPTIGPGTGAVVQPDVPVTSIT